MRIHERLVFRLGLIVEKVDTFFDFPFRGCDACVDLTVFRIVPDVNWLIDCLSHLGDGVFPTSNSPVEAPTMSNP